MSRTRFSDLATGERFVFDDVRECSPRFNVQFGPFTKTGATRFADRDKTFRQAVDSPTHYVVRLPEATR